MGTRSDLPGATPEQLVYARTKKTENAEKRKVEAQKAIAAMLKAGSTPYAIGHHLGLTYPEANVDRYLKGERVPSVATHEKLLGLMATGKVLRTRKLKTNADVPNGKRKAETPKKKAKAAPQTTKPKPGGVPLIQASGTVASYLFERLPEGEQIAIIQLMLDALVRHDAA